MAVVQVVVVVDCRGRFGCVLVMVVLVVVDLWTLLAAEVVVLAVLSELSVVLRLSLPQVLVLP